MPQGKPVAHIEADQDTELVYGAFQKAIYNHVQELIKGKAVKMTIGAFSQPGQFHPHITLDMNKGNKNLSTDVQQVNKNIQMLKSNHKSKRAFVKTHQIWVNVY